MSKKLKKFNEMKTRKAVLIFAIIMIVLYTALDILFTWLHTSFGIQFQFDSTLTSEWFEFWKWLVVTGTTITIAKIAKGGSNSDDDELPPEGE